jgi:hypothetical protein
MKNAPALWAGALFLTDKMHRLEAVKVSRGVTGGNPRGSTAR